MKRSREILILIVCTVVIIFILSGCSSYESGGYDYISGGEFGDTDDSPGRKGATFDQHGNRVYFDQYGIPIPRDTRE